MQSILNNKKYQLIVLLIICAIILIVGVLLSNPSSNQSELLEDVSIFQDNDGNIVASINTETSEQQRQEITEELESEFAGRNLEVRQNWVYSDEANEFYGKRFSNELELESLVQNSENPNHLPYDPDPDQ